VSKGSSGSGIVSIGEDAGIEAGAKRARIALTTAGRYGPPPFGKTLFVQPKTAVPWDLLSVAYHFLERWDAAVPLWRYGVLAANVGREAEREQTAEVVGDLRVLLYAHELLFVRNNAAGRALMAVFAEELEGGGEARLAFLRAFFRVKPKMCVLPRSWLAEVARRTSEVQHPRGRPLVTVEVDPGRYVQCYAGDEEQVRERLRARRSRRRR